MAVRLIETKRLINTNVVLAWRTLPTHLGIVGKLPLLITAVDSDRVPTKDPGNRPWGRYTLDIGEGHPTSISGRRWRVEGSFLLQVLVRNSQSNASDIADKAGAYIVNYMTGISRKLAITSIGAITRSASNGYARTDVVGKFYWDEVRSKPKPVSNTAPPVNITNYVFNDIIEVVTDETGEPLEVI